MCESCPSTFFASHRSKSRGYGSGLCETDEPTIMIKVSSYFTGPLQTRQDAPFQATVKLGSRERMRGTLSDPSH